MTQCCLKGNHTPWCSYSQNLRSSCSGPAQSVLQLCFAGSVDYLVVAVLSLGFVGEKLAELGQKFFPVAGNIFHSQVVEDEFLPPVGRLGSRKVM